MPVSKRVGIMVAVAMTLAACTAGDSTSSSETARSATAEDRAFSHPTEITNQYVPLEKVGAGYTRATRRASRSSSRSRLHPP